MGMAYIPKKTVEWRRNSPSWDFNGPSSITQRVCKKSIQNLLKYKQLQFESIGGYRPLNYIDMAINRRTKLQRGPGTTVIGSPWQVARTTPDAFQETPSTGRCGAILFLSFKNRPEMVINNIYRKTCVYTCMQNIQPLVIQKHS